jgi:hypothetical protein
VVHKSVLEVQQIQALDTSKKVHDKDLREEPAVVAKASCKDGVEDICRKGLISADTW